MMKKSLLMVVLLCGVLAGAVWAQDGTWSQAGIVNPYTWGDTGNWLDEDVATGADSTAFFTNSASGAQIVNMASPVTIGNLILNRTQNLTITNATLTLDVDTGVPVIDVSGSSSRILTLSNVITSSDGLQKDGVGILKLTSFTNTISGGITLNGGSIGQGASGGSIFTSTLNNNNITVNGAATLFVGNVTTTGSITLNAGGVLTTSSNTGGITVDGPVTGSGGWNVAHWGGAGHGVSLNSLANSFTGTVSFTTSQVLGMSVASFADPVGAGNIRFTAGGTPTFAFGSTAIAPLTLNNRRFELVSGSTAAYTIANNSAQEFRVNSPLLIGITGGSRTLTLGGTGSGLGVFASKLENGTLDSLGLTKSGVGRWMLTDEANTYSGITTISGGTLIVSKLANGGSNSSIGSSTSAAANLLFSTGSTLRYEGAGDTTDRQFTFSATAINALMTLNSSGTGAIQFTNTVDFTYAGTANQTRNLYLSGSNTGNNLLAANLLDNGTNTLTLFKSGTGTWGLGGSNTNTGAATLSGGGALVLDYSSNNDSKLADGSALTFGGTTLGGSTLELKGGGHTEVVSGTTLIAGGSFITRSGSSTGKLRMNAINRGAGGTIDFADASIADTDSTESNGILGGYATLGDDWAINSTVGEDGAITALSSYTGALPSSGAGSSSANYTLSGPQEQSSTVAANTVRISGSGSGDTLALGGNALTITSTSTTALGGILYVGGGDDIYNITNTAGSGLNASGVFDLVINTVRGVLNVSARINGSNGARTLVKTGAGKLIVSSANGYTGLTYVNQGVLQIRNATATGTTAAGIYVQNGAALELADDVAIGEEALWITGSGISGGGALRNVAASTSSYGGAITIGEGGARINSDAGGSLTLAGNLITAVFNDVAFGGSGSTAISGVISGAGSLIKDGAGTLTLSGASANTYTGETVVNGGTLLIASTAGAIGSTLRIASGAEVELADGVNETVGVLYLDGQPASAGTWGGPGSGATNEDGTYFAGSGIITVLQLGDGTPYTAKGPSGTLLIVR